jgi:hypothetical protein
MAKRKLGYGENLRDWTISSQGLNYLNLKEYSII